MQLSLGFFHEFAFQHHAAEAVDFAVDVVVGAGDDADVFHFGALFDALAAAFGFERFDEDDAVAILQDGAVGVQHLFFLVGGGRGGVPFKGAFGADVQRAVVVGVGALALRAGETHDVVPWCGSDDVEVGGKRCVLKGKADAVATCEFADALRCAGVDDVAGVQGEVVA